MRHIGEVGVGEEFLHSFGADCRVVGDVAEVFLFDAFVGGNHNERVLRGYVPEHFDFTCIRVQASSVCRCNVVKNGGTRSALVPLHKTRLANFAQENRCAVS